MTIEADRDGQQVLEAERWGATLQEEFCRESRYVPVVYEHGTHGQYFFIAMEYLDGRNLSEVISRRTAASRARGSHRHAALRVPRGRGRLRAHARWTCTFNRLLHGDLKPRNIRVLDGDEIKVFDFGIAKALSLSRKVTRNDFGSIAYLSPERLESGEIDAQAEFWAVGVLLYEMVSGVQPFRAADTRRLEQRIRARLPPAALDGSCPAGLRAIIAKLLAPAAADRYNSATAIRDDLRRFTAGEPAQAQREGWPDRGHDEAATRRTHRPAAVQGPGDEEVTRRTVRDPRDSSAARPTEAAVADGRAPAPAPQPFPTPRRPRLRWLVRQALTVIAIVMVLNEIRVYVIAGALVANVPQEIGGMTQMWNQYHALNAWSMNLGVRPLERALIGQTSVLSEGTFARYRTAGGTVYEKEWRQARDALGFAAGADPWDRQLRAALRYCEGHLRRIDGEARFRNKQVPAAQQELTLAVTAFREAAELRQKWPDPFLGLMRVFIATEDIERGADALAQAQRYGYAAGNRDWAMLGEGYLTRAVEARRQ